MTKNGNPERRVRAIGVGTALLCAWISLGAAPALAAGSPLSLGISTDSPVFVQTVPARVSATVTGGTPPFNFVWDHGDGSWSTNTGPSETYAYPNLGPFIVTCTVRDSAGTTASASIQIIVQRSICPSGGECPGMINVTIWDACSHQLVPMYYPFRYYIRVGDVLSYYSDAPKMTTWDFGDGTFASGAGTSHVYVSPGTYTVRVTDGDNVGAVFIDVSSIYSPPAVSVSASPAQGPPAVPIALFVSSSVGTGAYTRFTWDFGDGSTASTTGPSTSHTYQDNGTYLVTATVLDTQGAAAAGSTTVVVTPADEPKMPRLLVPGLAYADGQNGALWVSDLSVFNPDPDNYMIVYLTFLDGQEQIGDMTGFLGRFIGRRIEPRSTLFYPNALSSLFGLGKGKFGAVYLYNAGGDVAPVASVRTYDADPGRTGTVGLAATGIPFPTSRPAASSSWDLTGLADGVQRHTNLGLVNLRAEWVRVEVSFFDDAGTKIGKTLYLHLFPYEVRQLTNVLVHAGIDAGKTPASGFRARVLVPEGSAVYPYASVIDQSSNDPSFVDAQSVPSPATRVPGIVRAPGRNGTLWRSDVVLSNPGAATRSLDVTYVYRKNGGERASTTRPVVLAPGETRTFADFVAGWLGAEDKDSYTSASVDVRPGASDPTPSAPVLASGRVANRQSGGDVGTAIPGFTASEAASAGGPSRRLVLSGLRSSATSRSNVAVFLPGGIGGQAVSGALRIYDTAGALLRSVFVGLDATNDFAQISVDDQVRDLPGDKSSLAVVIENLSGPGSLAAYATVIDQDSGDPALIRAKAMP